MTVCTCKIQHTQIWNTCRVILTAATIKINQTFKGKHTIDWKQANHRQSETRTPDRNKRPQILQSHSKPALLRAK